MCYWLPCQMYTSLLCIVSPQLELTRSTLTVCMREKYLYIIFCKSMHRSEAFRMEESCVSCQGNDIRSILHRLDMKSEKDRLQTFDVWQYSHIQDPRTLAKAGLYYTGIDDKVKCPFCYGLLKKWERSDVPYHEHAKYFPKCRFIRGYDVGNIPISVPRDMINVHINYNGNNILYNGHQYIPMESSNVLIPPEPLPYSVNGAASNPVIQNGQTKVINQGVPQPLGDFQDFYKHQENRLRSFSNWPRHLPQTPEVLSEAGFYHKPTPEKPDRVKCAYCAGKLFNWQVDDDPWIEHARCFHQCKYVQLCMGRDFVQDLLGGQEYPQEHTENGHADRSPFSSRYEEPSASSETSPKPSSLTPSILQTSEDPVSARMTSEPVQAVLQMGYPEQMVKQTVERCVRERPDNFPPAEELASMLMELEDQLPVEAAEPPHVMTPLQRLIATQSSGSDVASVPLTNGVGHSSVIENGCDDNSTLQRLTTATGSAVRKGINLKMRKDPISKVNVNGLTTHHSGVSKNGAVNGHSNHKRDIDTESLKHENSKLKDQFLCKICMENFVRVTFMPCGHLVCCVSCSRTVSDCPICRAPISGFVRTYF